MYHTLHLETPGLNTFEVLVVHFLPSLDINAIGRLGLSESLPVAVPIEGLYTVSHLVERWVKFQRVFLHIYNI